ncbi:MAG: hypothetical protein NMNS01_16610 [Nitrosomonas sp.]|nr:MAG: hypothetical protein NMNS01_16610 [Nitrosomonas sp.]
MVVVDCGLQSRWKSNAIGSIGAVIALHALEKERGIVIGWGEYLKIGGVVTGLQIIVVIIYMSGFWYFDLFPTL